MELALDELDGGARVRLRVPRPGDVEALAAICQDPDIRRFTRVPDPYTLDDAREYVNRAIGSWEDGGPAPWFVELNGELVGNIALVHLDREDGWGELGYWIAPAARGRGITSAAVRRVSDWAFDQLGLARLEIQTATGNLGSELVARRAGFTRESVRRSAAVLRAVDGLPACRTDMTVWVRLADDIDARATLVVDGELELRPVTEAITQSLVEAVRESQEALSPWMFWATTDYGPRDARVFIDIAAQGHERSYAISSRDDGAFHGICSLNRVDEIHRTANLGYWLRSTSTGRGLATRAARRLLLHALGDLALERIEIVISPANTARVGLAQRLDLAEEGLRQRAIHVGDDQHDARVFVAFPSHLERLHHAVKGRR